MLNKKMAKAFNEQINKEMYSAYLYMAMSAQCSEMGLKGFASWFMAQYHEEMFHAMKMYEYVLRQGETIQLKAISQPPAAFKSALDMFQQTLSHEQSVTKSLNDLMDLATDNKDHASKIFLGWYITEQVEEEDNDKDIINQLKLIGDNGQGILMLDRELGSRSVTVPTDFSKGVGQGEEAAAT